jgi:hypothetical protein
VSAGLLAALVLFGFAPGVVAAEALPALSLGEYALRIDAIRADLEAGRRASARNAARSLMGRSVAWGEETLSPDVSLLALVAADTDASGGAAVVARLRRLHAALGEGTPGASAELADAELLARLTPADGIARGGDVPRLEVEPIGLPEQIGAAFSAAFEWLGSVLGRILDWFASLRPERNDPAPEAGRTAVAAMLFAVALAGVLAWLVWRSRGVGARVDEDEPVPSVDAEPDADPLSREASGWERRAAELAAARRYREAVRAWYHAVLVALFHAGRLHHQKGRTNWEYAARLDPRLGFRPAFVELTRLFDREWYGRQRSDAMALDECARQAREILAALPGAGRAA